MSILMQYLFFSYVGYQTQELNVSGRNKIDVVLHDDQQVLEEVVVVGYGSLSKKRSFQFHCTSG